MPPPRRISSTPMTCSSSFLLQTPHTACVPRRTGTGGSNTIVEQRRREARHEARHRPFLFWARRTAVP